MTKVSKPVLLAGCAIGALLILQPSRAAAQSFNGSDEVVTGSASVTHSPAGVGTPATTDIVLFTDQTVINWYTFDTLPGTPIDFQPEGTVATFTGFADTGNFTVLNRILPLNGNSEPTSAFVQLNGTVESFFNESPAGNVWFYSPYGLIVGPTATFNVGSLILTTNDIQFTENCIPCESYGSIYGANGLVQFRGGAGSAGFVDVRPGAHLNAIGSGSYIALVAPRVIQGGAVSANRSIAYIGAEQVDMTINAGMFDIQILEGTTDAKGVIHSGSSTGAASTGFSDAKQIFIAAVSKNDALTMMLSGSLGYLPASSVFNDGSSVVLSAGADGSPPDNILIGDATFTNRVNARATGGISIAPTPGSAATGTLGGTTSFESYTNLFADRSFTILADHGSTVSALQGLNFGAYDSLGDGGDVSVEARGPNGLSGRGRIMVTGGLTATAAGYGISPPETAIGGNGFGGSIDFKANGGAITADYIDLNAQGYGGYAEFQGGDGTGGSILVSAGYGGTITSPSSSFSARGLGGGVYGEGGVGGVGYGGDIELTDSGVDLGPDTVGGELALGYLTLNASADGGYSDSFGSGRGGDAFGGDIDVTLSRQDQSFGYFEANVNAQDGDTSIDPMAGTIDMVVGGGVTVNVADNLNLFANSLSGVNGGPSATGDGGTVNLTVQGAATLNVAGSLHAEARANVLMPFGGIDILSTPTVTGGTVNVLADGGTLAVRDLLVDVTARNFAAQTFAGTATGGDASVEADNAGLVYVAGVDGIGGQFIVTADGFGGVGTTPANAAGGSANLFADNGSTINSRAGSISVSANAEDGYDFDEDIGRGLDAEGGTASVGVGPGGTIFTSFMSLSAHGNGGASSDSIAGSGTGGAATVLDTGGNLDFTVLDVDVRGNGGDGPLQSGGGTGGRATIDILGAAQSWSFLTVNASGYAGLPGAGGTGGAASSPADAIDFSIAGPGSLSVSGVDLFANAVSVFDGPAGYIGQAGGIDLTVSGGATLTANSIYADASALFDDYLGTLADTTPVQHGGTAHVTADGGAITAYSLDVLAEAETLSAVSSAGSATGGEAIVSALDGGSITLLVGEGGTDLVTISANAFGAPGPMAADATGGTAQLILDDGQFTTGGDILVSADGGIAELYETPDAGPGFNAAGGSASIELRAGLDGTAALTARDIDVTALGDGRLFLTIGTLLPDPGYDEPILGDGGDGSGGSAGLAMQAGTLDLASLTIDSGGAGSGSSVSDGAAAYQSGDGFGGSSTFAMSGGSATVGPFELLSNGFGGNGTSGPAAEGSQLAALAGNGTGGAAGLQLDGGSLVTTVSVLRANGLGAPGMNHIDDGVATAGGTGTGGSATLTTSPAWSGSFTTGSLLLQANGDGGVGGFSDPGSADPPLGMSGNGGDGTGGTATADLADGEFSLGLVNIEAIGTGGYSGDASSGNVAGAQGGYGSGGTARFALVDSPAGPAGLPGSRVIDDLRIEATGYGGFGSSFVQQNAPGYIDLFVQVLSPEAALTLPGNLTLDASGVDLVFPSGVRAIISGAPLDVGGNILVRSSAGAINVQAEQPLRAAGQAIFDGFTFDSSGLIQSGTFMAINGLFRVIADRLTSGGTTDLYSQLGPIVVGDLLSTDLVFARGNSIEIRSSAGLRFSIAEARAGDMQIETVGDLEISGLLSTGFVDLLSTAGNITTGSFTAGNWIHANAFLGVSLGDIEAANDAAVSARGGDLIVGNVTAGDDIWLSLFGSDPARLLTAGNLVTTGLGDNTAAGPPVLFGAFPNGAGPAGNVIRVRSSGSIDVVGTQGPGRVILVADAGTITGGALAADEALILLGRGDISIADASTSGLFYVGDSSLFVPNLPDAYDAAALDGVTPIRTSGGFNVGNAVSAGDITVAVAGDAVAPSWTASRRLLIDSGAIFTASGGAAAGTSASITGDLGIDLASLTSGGTTQLASPNGPVDVDLLVSPGTVAVTGQSVDIRGSGPLTFTTAQATGGLSIVTSGNLAFASVAAGQDLTLGSTAGALTATGNVSGGSVNLSAEDDILVGGGLTSGSRLLVDTVGSFTVQGAAIAGEAGITADHGITMPSLQSDRTELFAFAGNIVIPELLASGNVTARGRDIAIGSTGALAFDQATASAGDVDIATSGNLTAGLLAATGSIHLQSGGVFALSGTAFAPTIHIVSSDIAIGLTSQVGRRELTTEIVLTSGGGAARTVIGNGVGANAGDYTLAQGEAARLFADDTIEIASPRDIAIGDLAIGFGDSRNIGSGGTMKVTTPAVVSIVGDILLSTSSADDTFEIDPRLIALNTDTGSIAMLTGSGGAALGSLELIGDRVAIATGSVLSQLETLTDFEVIKDLLDTPGGASQPLRAGSMLFDVGNGLFIQNTGASDGFADRRGFTAQRVDIVTEDNSARIAINGQIFNTTGTISGLDVIPLVNINGAPASAGGRFNPASTINGCTIGTNCAFVPPPLEPERPESPNLPTNEDLETPSSPADGPLLFVPLIELARTEPLITSPLVDEPITGVGNDDLWEPRCELGSDDPACVGGDGL